MVYRASIFPFFSCRYWGDIQAGGQGDNARFSCRHLSRGTSHIYFLLKILKLLYTDWYFMLVNNMSDHMIEWFNSTAVSQQYPSSVSSVQQCQQCPAVFQQCPSSFLAVSQQWPSCVPAVSQQIKRPSTQIFRELRMTLETSLVNNP